MMRRMRRESYRFNDTDMDLSFGRGPRGRGRGKQGRRHGPKHGRYGYMGRGRCWDEEDAETRRAWLEDRRQHLKARLAEVEEELAALAS